MTGHPPDLTAYATLDTDRAARRGFPEAVYCAGKTPDQVAGIAAAVVSTGAVTLFTRADPERAHHAATNTGRAGSEGNQ